MEKGARDEAERDLNAAIRADPHLAEAYFNLSLLDTPQAEAPWVKQMESVYPRRDALSAAQRCYLEFAMGKVLESLGRYDEAFAAYRTGNELFYRESAFDEAADEHWFTDTIRADPHLAEAYFNLSLPQTSVCRCSSSAWRGPAPR